MSAIGSLEVADVIPGYLSGIFPFKSFNAMQTIVARQLLETDVEQAHIGITLCLYFS